MGFPKASEATPDSPGRFVSVSVNTSLRQFALSPPSAPTTIALPDGTADGDLLIAICVANLAGQANPAGWNTVGGDERLDGGDEAHGAVYVKVLEHVASGEQAAIDLGPFDFPVIMACYRGLIPGGSWSAAGNRHKDDSQTIGFAASGPVGVDTLFPYIVFHGGSQFAAQVPPDLVALAVSFLHPSAVAAPGTQREALHLTPANELAWNTLDNGQGDPLNRSYFLSDELVGTGGSSSAVSFNAWNSPIILSAFLPLRLKYPIYALRGEYTLAAPTPAVLSNGWGTIAQGQGTPSGGP